MVCPYPPGLGSGKGKTMKRKRPTIIDFVAWRIRFAVWRDTNFGLMPCGTRHFYGGDSTVVTWWKFWAEWPVR